MSKVILPPLLFLLLGCGSACSGPQKVPSRTPVTEVQNCEGSDCEEDYFKVARIEDALLHCPKKDVDGDGKITWHDCYIWDHCKRAPENCVNIKYPPLTR